MDDTGRSKSRSYPAHPLGEVVEMASQLQRSLGRGPFSRQDMANALGFAPDAGSTNRRIAAIGHFGLLDGGAEGYRLTSLATQILMPTAQSERDQALRDAVRQPPLYAQLIDRYDGQRLPDLLQNILSREFGILPTKAKFAASIFRKSLDQAGLLVGDRVESTAASLRNAVALAPEEGGSAAVKPQQMAPVPTAQTAELTDSDRYAIPLSNRRVGVLYLPTPLKRADINRIKAWLDLMTEPLLDDSSNPDSDD